MSEENVEIVRGLYEAWNRTGGVPPRDAISSDIEVEFTGGILTGKYRGHGASTKPWKRFGVRSRNLGSTLSLAARAGTTCL